MLAVTSVDAYPFFFFRTLRILELVFSGCTVPLDSMETWKLGSSGQETSSSADKNIKVFLVSFCTWKCVPTAITGGVDNFKVPACHLF